MIFTNRITTNLILSKISNALPGCRQQSLKSRQTASVKVITENSTSDFYNTTLIDLSFFALQLKDKTR